MTIFGIHITDLNNRIHIEKTGLKTSENSGLWLGRGLYHYLLYPNQSLDRCIISGKIFASQKPNFSGEISVVVSKINTDRLIPLQEDIVTRVLKEFRTVFDEKCNLSKISIPMNNKLFRPASYIRYEIWRQLANKELEDALQGDKIAGTICSFHKGLDEDIPDDLPPEACVYEPDIQEICFIGSPEEVREFLSNHSDTAKNGKMTNKEFQLKVVGATATIISRIQEMENRDFEALLKKHVNRDKSFSNVIPIKTVMVPENVDVKAQTHVPHKRLMNAVRTKRVQDGVQLDEVILEHDLNLILLDFKRRLRVTDQIPLDIQDVSLRIGHISDDPTFAAKDLARRFGKNNVLDNFERILKRLPIEIRKLKGLKGQAYYFPKGELTNLAVLVTGKGNLNINGKPTRIAFNRAHELGHFIFQECKINAVDEELWCDRFAGALLDDIEKSQQTTIRVSRHVPFEEIVSDR